MAQGTQTIRTTRSLMTTRRRPGWVTFAAVITFVVAFFYALSALVEFSNSNWFVTTTYGTYSLFSAHFFWWGVIDACIAALSIVAAVSMLRGGFFGLFMGLAGAGLSMLRWMFYIPSDPWLAVSIIVIDALVIYGLCTSVDYFTETPAQ